MAFSTKIKGEVKYKSRYICVFCKQLGLPLDVHHIIPESEGGPDGIDNAICLCPTHHRQFGHNLDFYDYLRKERDKWYEYCEKFLPDANKIKEQFDKLKSQFSAISKQAARQDQNLQEIKTIVVQMADTVISTMGEVKGNLEKEEVTPSDIASAAVAVSGSTASSRIISSYGISSIDSNVKPILSPPYLITCPGCGHDFEVGSEIGGPAPLVCPNCGLLF